MIKTNSCVKSQEIIKTPSALSEYLAQENNRFTELSMYVDGISIDDLQYLKPKDLINLVPKEKHKHKLLMSVLVRRYLYRECEVSSSDES